MSVNFAQHVCEIRKITNTLVTDHQDLRSHLFLMHYSQILACVIRASNSPSDAQDALWEAMTLAETERYEAAMLIYHAEVTDTPYELPPSVRLMGQCYVQMGRKSLHPMANMSPFIWDTDASTAYFVDSLVLPAFGDNLSQDPLVQAVGQELRSRFDNSPSGDLSVRVRRLESMGHHCHLIGI